MNNIVRKENTGKRFQEIQEIENSNKSWQNHLIESENRLSEFEDTIEASEKI